MRRHFIAAVVLSLIVGAGIGAGAMALAHPRASTEAIDNTSKTVQVTAKVEKRPARAPIELQAKLIPSTTTAIALNTGQGKALVTKSLLKPGDAVHAGDLLGEVSSHPVFAITKDVPLFRDLAPGVEGTDVKALQTFLSSLGYYAGSAGGKYDAATSAAVAAWYKDNGYTAPKAGDKPGNLPLSDVATIPAGELTVVSACPTGDEPTTAPGAAAAPAGKPGAAPAAPSTSDHAFVVVQTAGGSITTRIDVLQSEALKAGTAVTVSSGSMTGKAQVASVGAFQSAGDNKPAGYDISITVPSELANADASKPVMVRESAPPPTGLAVPLTALRDENGASYVSVVAAGGSTAKVTVTVLSTAGGWATIADTPELPLGADVVVSA